MNDTIAIIIPEEAYANLELNRFRVLSNNGYIKYVRNPTDEEQISGYKPNLTIYERGFNEKMGNRPMTIEISIPKMIFNGENISEVRESDFEVVINTLKQRLSQMGIRIWDREPFLENAFVSKIDFSKNIILEDGITTSIILRDLSKIDVSKRADFDKKDFKIDGRELQIYYKSYALAFYDKVSEIINNSKGKFDKYNNTQQVLFDEYEAKRTKEVFRYEVRLKRVKLKSLLKEIGFNRELTFKNIFSEVLSKQILQYFWQEYIINESYAIILFDDKPERAFQRINDNAKRRISLKDNLALLGSSVLADKYGMKGFREIVETKYHTRTWSRFREGFLKKNLPVNIESFSYINYVSKALDKFEPISIKDIGLNELDNVK